VAATSYASRDLYYINLLKLLPIKADYSKSNDMEDLFFADVYLDLWQEKVALIRKEDIDSFSFESGTMMWINSNEKVIKIEQMCMENQYYNH